MVPGRREGAAGCAQHLVTRNPDLPRHVCKCSGIIRRAWVFCVRVEDIVGVHGMHVHVPGCSVCMLCVWFAQGGVRHVPV